MSSSCSLSGVAHAPARSPRRGTRHAPRRDAITVVRIALDQLSPAVDRHHAVDDTQQGVHDVLDPHDRRRPSASDLADRVDQFEHLGLGQPTGDLVEQQHAGCVASARASSSRLR